MRTDFLFPKTSFLTGLGSCFNIAGNYYSYNFSRTSQEADARAGRSDWAMVGMDIRESYLKFLRDYEKREKERHICLPNG